MDKDRQSAVDCIVQALESDVDPSDFNLTREEALESRKQRGYQRGYWSFYTLLEVDDTLLEGSSPLLAQEILFKAEELARHIARAKKVVAEGEELKVGEK